MTKLTRVLASAQRRPVVAAGAAVAIALTGSGLGIGVAQAQAVPHLTASAAHTQHSASMKHSMKCITWMTNQHPADQSTVGVKVHTVGHAHVKVVAFYQAMTFTEKSKTHGGGRHTFWFKVGHTKPGFEIKVHVHTSRRGKTGQCATWFIVRGAHAPHVTPTPTPTPTIVPIPHDTPTPTPTPSCTPDTPGFPSCLLPSPPAVCITPGIPPGCISEEQAVRR